ncbi:hypothetical protein SKAU_G00075800 [Synaphobranchus kaupii]|uniref:Uncharacterized protein n=1 Tax=Synaphobranchus kaupii TaxID=118154 RepID=A0A9Q1G996_SYNKA|nr:hypothetical protein SKAU_G00075800 [Synaphobranchus kaupii]
MSDCRLCAGTVPSLFVLWLYSITKPQIRMKQRTYCLLRSPCSCSCTPKLNCLTLTSVPGVCSLLFLSVAPRTVYGSPAASALAPAHGPPACSRPFLTLVARTCSELRTGLVPVQPPPGPVQAAPFPSCLWSAWLMPRHSPPVWFLTCPAPARLARPGHPYPLSS